MTNKPQTYWNEETPLQLRNEAARVQAGDDLTNIIKRFLATGGATIPPITLPELKSDIAEEDLTDQEMALLKLKPGEDDEMKKYNFKKGQMMIAVPAMALLPDDVFLLGRLRARN